MLGAKSMASCTISLCSAIELSLQCRELVKRNLKVETQNKDAKGMGRLIYLSIFIKFLCEETKT